MTNHSIGTNHPVTGNYSPLDQSNWSSAKYPLGAYYVEQNVTFAVYSRNATRILLEIYDKPMGERAQYDYWMIKNPQDDIWRACIAGVKPYTFYAFRCWGSNWSYNPNWDRGNSSQGFEADVDDQGNRFNPNKVLFDPYARELSHDRETPRMIAAGESAKMYATGGGDYNGVVSREYDTTKWCPKGIVLPKDSTSTGTKPYLPREKAIIYEAHVRGMTKHPSASRLEDILANIPGYEEVVNVPEAYRGTYLGAGYMAKYLKALGLTTIEWLPIHEICNESIPDDRLGGNYWGYMTFGYFAPDRRYAYDKSPGGPTREFKAMVKAFHDEGLEVYLDVVYNHSGEGGNWDEDINVTGFLSFGGFDVIEYYQLNDDHYLVDGATGCGNQLNFSHSVTQNLVIDSVTYWLEEMGVDGFRFDLAPVLGRTPSAFPRESWAEQKQFFPDHSLLQSIRELGDRYQAEMIAEAWDIWSYEVGNFPQGWGEWNGRYRDGVRKFCKGDGNTYNFIDVVNGDYDYFNDRGPHHSINFVVAHDGFTLMDLVSYKQKNNEISWPFGPSDGGNNNNNAWDSGGDHSLRRQRLRNFWTIQFLSRGVPLVVWGDEFCRTQNGNNNPYNIDSIATWNNYEMIATRSPHLVPTGYPDHGYHNNFGTGTNSSDCNPLFIFATYIAHLRQRHVALKQREYADFYLNSGEDVTYLFTKPDGSSNLIEGDRCVSLRINGSEVQDHDFLVLINMSPEAVLFRVPSGQSPHSWVRIIDTAGWAEPEYNCWTPDKGAIIWENYWVHPWAIAVLQEID
ncbi:glycogen-debranching protein [Gloeocapsa sp. PCC 73106]|uniref:glycogen debranching protein n=1 Tax=Gloeocapsa sp. PCC 73106 TaxID=102232 RepID=UPI0002ABAD34|nr:isoamylase [Gloeocapsa sp. PCC 73106]ELR97150.1 pullulanase-like glycosidase possibly secreted by type II secretory pathway [Gloeocapsa sp. PCC 73106]